jgi:hypothetical protein
MSIQKNTSSFLKHSGLSFTTTINQTTDLIKDPASLGIYVYLAGKPENWNICLEHLKNRFGKGRDYIRARLADLKSVGLLKTEAIKSADGRVVRWETTLISYVPNQITENPYRGENTPNQITENPQSSRLLKTHIVVDPTLVIKEDLKIKDKNKPPIIPHSKNDESETIDTQMQSAIAPVSDCFELFWEEWPVKQNKKKAQDIWKRKKLDKKATLILEQLRQQKQNDERWSQGYIPNATTYLNGERWTDELYRGSRAIKPGNSQAQQQKPSAGCHKPVTDILREREAITEKVRNASPESRANGTRSLGEIFNRLR